MTAGNYNRTGEGKEFLSNVYYIKNDFLYQLLIYSSFLPLNVYFLIDMLLLIQRIKLQKLLNEDSNNIMIHNHKILKSIRNIKIAVMEKNSIVDPGKPVIRGLYDFQTFCQDFGIPQQPRSQSGISPQPGSPSNFTRQVERINSQVDSGEVAFEEKLATTCIYLV